MRINKILIPNKPHLDPIAAIYLLKQYGQEKFPGISDAEIIFWEHSHDPSEEEKESLKEGVLMIDMGGGTFDHHQIVGNTKETAASLVAAYLGIDNNPELSAFLGYIREDDLEGLHNRYGDLAYILKCMHKQNEPVETVVEFALQTLKYLQVSQKEWHYNVKNEFEQKVKLVRVKRFKRKLKIGIIESDNLQVGNYGLTVANLSAVIQKRSSGHVMILTNKHHRLDLRESVAAIRKKELELMNYDKEIDVKKLQYEGKSQLIPNWFYHKSLNAFLNGSDALAKAEPTRVPFKDIVRFVLYGLATGDSELCDCHKGGEKCPYKNYGFSACLSRKPSLNNDFCFLVNIDDRFFSSLPEEKEINNQKFRKKNEFHFTVINFQNSYKIKEAAKSDPTVISKINEIISGFHWNFIYHPENKKYILKKNYQKRDGTTEERMSIISSLVAPDIENFYLEVKEKIGLDLGDVPPAHVTLYTKGNLMGIGINSKEELEKYTLSEINFS